MQHPTSPNNERKIALAMQKWLQTLYNSVFESTDTIADSPECIGIAIAEVLKQCYVCFIRHFPAVFDSGDIFSNVQITLTIEGNNIIFDIARKKLFH